MSCIEDDVEDGDDDDREKVEKDGRQDVIELIEPVPGDGPLGHIFSSVR